MTFLHLLEGVRTPAITAIMFLVSLIGTPHVILGIMEWFYLNVNKKNAYLMFVSYHFSTLLCQGVKIIVHEPRPWIVDNTFHPVEESLFMAAGYSFPSIHTASTTVYGVSRLMTAKKAAARSLALSLMLLVPFSRMYLGCHTPSDVLWGFLFSAFVTVVVFLIARKKSASGYDGILLFFPVAFAGLLLFLAIFLIGSNEIDISHAKDCFSTVGCVCGFVLGAEFERARLDFDCTSGRNSHKLVRFLICVLGAVGIHELVGIFIQNSGILSMIIVTVQYFLVTFWMTYLAPRICLSLGLLKKK